MRSSWLASLTVDPRFANTARSAVTVEGTWKFSGGDGEYRGITGGGKFKTVMKSETEVEATGDGNFELAKAQTR